MLYKVTVISGENKIVFRFNSFNDMSEYLQIVMETVDGFETGETQVMVSKEEKNPTEGNP